MYKNTRFGSLMKCLSRRMTENAIKHHNSDKGCKGFTTWNHLVSMVYGQISGARSLRELEVGFNSQSRHHYHLGCREIKRSTLSDANTKRSCEVFKDLCGDLISQAHRKVRSEVQSLLYLLDSSPITLKGLGYDDWAVDNGTSRTQGLKLHLMIEAKQAVPVWIDLTAPNVNDIQKGREIEIEKSATYVFDKGYCDYNWWFDIHSAGATFVTRFKRNAGITVINQRDIPEEASDVILSDNVVTFKNKRPGGKRINHYYGQDLRQIIVPREDKERPLIIATNDMKSSALQIAALYKRRWEIELFFKWIKQNLKIKKFLGRSENAVKIQIYTALITYLLAQTYRNQSGYTNTLRMFIALLRSGLFQQPDIDYRLHKRRKYREAISLSMQEIGRAHV